jgi:glyoxylase-like metal-dependent hydrolase (beta-lactamase superfamily II)
MAILVAAVVLTFALIGFDTTRAETVVAAASERSPDKGYVVQEIRDGIYWLSDGAYNTMFVVTNAGVIAVDPLPTLGENYLKAIAEVTDKPITHIIYSHENTDHIGGAYLFPKTATVVAQRETATLLATRTDPRRPLPMVTFETPPIRSRSETRRSFSTIEA